MEIQMMSDDTKNDLTTSDIPDNVQSIDDARIDRMAEYGHLQTMYERFEILRIKFMYDDLKEAKEIIEFVTYVKYFKDYGPSEGIRLSCHYLYEKHVKKMGL